MSILCRDHRYAKGRMDAVISSLAIFKENCIPLGGQAGRKQDRELRDHNYIEARPG